MQALVLSSEGKLTFLIVMMLAGFVGSIWMFLHASDHFGPFIAFILVVLNLWTLLETTIPLVFFGYLGMWFVGNIIREISARRELKEQTNLEAGAKRGSFGLKRDSLNPEEDARALELPSIVPKRESGALSLLGNLPELDELLKAGRIEEALNIAEEGWKRAREAGDDESADIYRYYLERIQRGEW